MELTPEDDVTRLRVEAAVVALDEDVATQLQTRVERDADPLHVVRHRAVQNRHSLTNSRSTEQYTDKTALTLLHLLDARGEDGRHALVDFDEGAAAAAPVEVGDAVDDEVVEEERVAVDLDASGQKPREVVHVPA